MYKNHKTRSIQLGSSRLSQLGGISNMINFEEMEIHLNNNSIIILTNLNINIWKLVDIINPILNLINNNKKYFLKIKLDKETLTSTVHQTHHSSPSITIYHHHFFSFIFIFILQKLSIVT